MVKNKRLRQSGFNILNEAYKAGKFKSRNDLKTQGIAHKVISSKRSFELHVKNWDRFVDWTEAHGHEIKRVSALNADVIEEYIRFEAKNGGRYGGGAAKSTLQSYLTAINKVGLAGELINVSETLTLTKLGEKAPVHFNEKSILGIYKDFTASEWIQENPKRFESYNQIISTVQAFGLRRKEVQELNKNSFILDEKTGKMFVQTIGKGGKFRVAEATVEKNDEMMAMYGDITKKVADIRQLKLNKEYLERDLQDLGARLNLKGNNSQKVPLHIFRSQYAQTLLNEKFERFNGFTEYSRGYTRIDLKTSNIDDLRRMRVKIKSYEGSALAFYLVSKNLGHNRLDVLTHYLKY